MPKRSTDPGIQDLIEESILKVLDTVGPDLFAHEIADNGSVPLSQAEILPYLDDLLREKKVVKRGHRYSLPPGPTSEEYTIRENKFHKIINDPSLHYLYMYDNGEYLVYTRVGDYYEGISAGASNRPSSKKVYDLTQAEYKFALGNWTIACPICLKSLPESVLFYTSFDEMFCDKCFENLMKYPAFSKDKQIIFLIQEIRQYTNNGLIGIPNYILPEEIEIFRTIEKIACHGYSK